MTIVARVAYTFGRMVPRFGSFGTATVIAALMRSP